MKKEILSVVMVITMLFSVIGCGGDATTKTNGTKVKIAFKSQKGKVFEKISDITKVLIDVKKDGEFIYEEKLASKVNGSWSATLNLNSNNTPYGFTTRAYRGDELLYKGDFTSTETLPLNLLLTLDEVRADTSFSLLPSLKKIETSFLEPIKGEDTAKKIRMKFTIVNLQSDNVDYSLLAIRKASNIKGQLVEVGDAGSFNPDTGALNFTNENELIFESVYTQPINPPDESTSSDVFSGGTRDFITTRLLLTNSKGDVITIPFTLPTYEEQSVSINFPPEVQKVDVLDEGEEHTVEVIVNDIESSTFTYEWEVLTGSTIIGSTATQNPLKLEAYDVSSNNSLCIRVKVSDVHGASTKVGYCLHGTGLVREGNVVTDVVRKVQWQDDEAVKTNSRAWLEVEGNNFYKGFDPVTGTYTPTGDTALPYCKALELDGYLDWRVPTKEELKTIVDKRFDPTIAENFTNIGISTAENPNIYYTTATQAKYIDEHGMYKDMLPFSQNRIDDNWNSYYAPKDKIYVRCIRDIVITPTSDNAVLKKTGQTKSYNQDGDEVSDGSVKDDGFYQKGLTSQYTRDDVAQTVTDHVTGLVWQDDEDAKTLSKNWNEAKAYCKNKGNGWYLPTIQELNTITDYSSGHGHLNSTFEKNADSSGTWSSTPHMSDSSNASWFILFFDDDYNNYSKLYNYSVRCVSSGE